MVMQLNLRPAINKGKLLSIISGEMCLTINETFKNKIYLFAAEYFQESPFINTWSDCCGVGLLWPSIVIKMIPQISPPRLLV